MADSYLLDTQVALWLLLDSPRLSDQVRQVLVANEGRIYFHQASTWEIVIKYELGKLPLPEPPGEFLLNAVTDSGLRYDTIKDEAIFFLNKLPRIHQDPFDRLLVSHVAVNGWVLITSDLTLISYPIRTMQC